MSTSASPHLRNGKGDSLARAKASLKERLMQKMKQEVLDELKDTERVVEDVVALFSGQENVVGAVKASLKARLMDQMRQQVLEEVVTEMEGIGLESVASEDALVQARDTFKVRLVDHMIQEAVAAVSSEAGWSQDALEMHAKGDIIREARETFKERLRERVFEQAVEEIGASVEGEAEGLLEKAQGDSLQAAKEAIKQRLLDHVLHQAIAEIDAEVDEVPEHIITLESLTSPDEQVSEAFQEELADDTALLDEIASEINSDLEDATLMDMSLWEEADEGMLEADITSSSETSLVEGDAPEGDEDGFFLNNPSEPGDGSEGEYGDNYEEIASYASPSDSDEPSEWEIVNTAPPPGGDPTNVSAAEVVTDLVTEFEAATEGVDGSDASGVRTLYYVYGVMSGVDLDEEALSLVGIDPEHMIYCLPLDHVSALVSQVAPEEYSAQARAEHAQDPAWMEQREAEHDVLIDALAQRGAFMPFPFGSVYDSEAEVRRMLSEISFVDALEKIQGRSQWRIQVYRNVDVLHQQVVEKSEAVQQLMADIKKKSKGAQSIKKKMVTTIREEEAAFTDKCTKDVHERLYNQADDVELGTLEGGDERDKLELILDASYLVHRDKHGAFREHVDLLIAEYASLGFEFDVAGPEPPTRFARLQPADTE